MAGQESQEKKKIYISQIETIVDVYSILKFWDQ